MRIYIIFLMLLIKILIIDVNKKHSRAFSEVVGWDMKPRGGGTVWGYRVALKGV